MWELDHKEGWQPTYWCFWVVVLEKTLENPLDCREIKPVNPKVNHPWILTGRADAEAKALILWHLMQTAHSLEKTECKRKGRQKTRWLDSIINSEDVSFWENSGRQQSTEELGMLQSTGLQRVQLDWATQQQQVIGDLPCSLRKEICV